MHEPKVPARNPPIPQRPRWTAAPLTPLAIGGVAHSGTSWHDGQGIEPVPLPRTPLATSRGLTGPVTSPRSREGRGRTGWHARTCGRCSESWGIGETGEQERTEVPPSLPHPPTFFPDPFRPRRRILSTLPIRCSYHFSSPAVPGISCSR